MPINYWLKFGNTPLGYNGSGVKFVHVEQPGTLTVSVQVSGTGFDPSKTFGFRVAFGSSIDYTVNGVAIPASSDAYTGSLANGQSVVLGNIPYGTAYSVTEDTIPGSDIGYFNGQVTGASGTMTDGGALSSVAMFEYDANSALIGGTRYRTTTINGITYMAENLDFKWPGLGIVTTPGQTSSPRAGYYNGDQATYGLNGLRYGLLYNLGAFKYLYNNAASLFGNGWRVMEDSDRDNLVFVSPGLNSSAKYLKSSTQWDGNDYYKFNAVPSGYGSYYNGWLGIGSTCRLAFKAYDAYPPDPPDILCISIVMNTGNDKSSGESFTSNRQYVSVRLCRGTRTT